MSDNEDQNELGSQDTRSVTIGSVAEDSNNVLPLDLHLDQDIISLSGTQQRKSGLEWLLDTLADDAVEAKFYFGTQGKVRYAWKL